MRKIPDELWVRDVLDAAADIPRLKYIDSEREVQPDEVVLGEIGEKMKQLFTFIRRLERKRSALMELQGRLSHPRTREEAEEKRKAWQRARLITIRVVTLKMIQTQQLQEGFKKLGALIKIRKGFLAVVQKKSSKDGFFKNIKGMFD